MLFTALQSTIAWNYSGAQVMMLLPKDVAVLVDILPLLGDPPRAIVDRDAEADSDASLASASSSRSSSEFTFA